MKQGSISRKRPGFLTGYIPNSKERKTIIFSLAVTVILILTGILYLSFYRQQLMAEDFRHYKQTFKQIGSISRIGFFATLSIYPVSLLLKLKKINKIKWGTLKIKTLLQPIGKLIRKWHAPIALLSTGIVSLHAYMAILRGFKPNFTYITGIITIIVLLFLLLMGLMRFKRKDKQWHFKLAIGFFVLFMIHATFS